MTLRMLDRSTDHGLEDAGGYTLRIQRPPTSRVGWAVLGLAVAAQLAGIVPPGMPSQVAGCGLTLAAIGGLVAGCVRRVR